jgi:hypothetical protein
LRFKIILAPGTFILILFLLSLIQKPVRFGDAQFSNGKKKANKPKPFCPPLGGIMNAQLSAITLLLLTLIAGRVSLGGDNKSSLSGEDKKYLDGLMKDFIFDPAGAERVAVKVTVRSVWGGAGESLAEGWHVVGKDGKLGRVYFTDGASIPAPAENARKKIDFVAECKARYTGKKLVKENSDDDPFDRMRRTAIGAVDNDDLAVAAWLHRLGHDELAAKALAVARKPEGDPEKRLRAELAWSAFAGMVHAYMVRADEEALGHGERFIRMYAKGDGEKSYGQAGKIVDELKRRQKKGTFGKEPPKNPPAGFDQWDAGKKVAYWIDALEEVDARQHGQPGGVDFGDDPRVQALIKLGDPAVPALIDALEKDERLTRSVHFWRDFARSRTVLSVREAEVTALMSILRVSVFEPASTGDNLTARGEDAAIELAKKLRSYWKEYGKLPFDERMMKVLTDPKTNFKAKREAADNLANLHNPRQYRTMFGPTIIGGEPPRKQNPAIAKFAKPTAAEAILAAMDAELKAHDAAKDKDAHGYERRRIESAYLNALGDLDDKRIGPELARRADNAKALRERRQWAYFAHFLDQPKAFAALAEDFRAGKITLPAGEEGSDELGGMIGSLIDVGTPVANNALGALADRKHPQYAAVAKKVLSERTDGFDRGPWFAHPFCLSILRGGLDDSTPTGGKFSIEKESLKRVEGSGWSSGGIPKFLADPKSRKTEAEERNCDRAADKLNSLVVAMPKCHPLLKDNEDRLTAMKKTLDRFAGNYRRANWRERDILDASVWNPIFLPDIRPLDRAATDADVKAGKAIFHLDGKGKPADLKLPAVGMLKTDAAKSDRQRVLIVQAEIGPDGVVCGVITSSEIRTISSRDLASIKSFADLDREEKESAAKEKEKAKEKQ